MSASNSIEERIVRIELGSRSYDVVIGAGSLASVGDRCAELFGRTRAFLVVDDQLPTSLVDVVLASLTDAGFDVAEASMRASEENKSIETAHALLQQLGSTGHERHEPVIALGGGVGGDVAGFVAATYKRGVPVVQCPTTLLSMVDASVGGKTGVNLVTSSGMKKNLVGAFWQPALVIADVHALQSLSARQFQAGMAECIKHGLIAGNVGHEGLLDWIESCADELLPDHVQTMVELVERNVRIKSAVVAADERELEASGQTSRMILNLGHTFGHALESHRSLSPDEDPANAPLLHGEAVALGLVAATAAAVGDGLVDETHLNRLKTLIDRIGLPTAVSKLPANASLIEVMGHDKKAQGGRLRIIVPESPERVRIVDGPPESMLAGALDALRTS